MSDSADMQLVFRLGGMGFTLPIDDLIEIREASAPVVEGDAHPQLDLRPAFGLAPVARTGALLVLCGESGPWVLPVDTVDGIFAAREFSRRPLPDLLRREMPGPCDGLTLWHEEPLHFCRALALERFGGRE